MSEADEIKRDGAKPVKNSGRSKGIAKGDAVLEPFLVDYKEYKQTFGVSRDMWAKLCTDAIQNGRRQPAFKLVLRENDEAGPKTRLWVISDTMFHEMLEAWKEKYEE
ncbi:Holliday junction resolvase [Streptomyces phage Wakanda]|uniref:Holliday junction resolvase n=2 Tax=Wakandavirus TaxID=3044854 RepID=A0A6G8R368_9CAUD|nr:Holliday junction resolvase [Streptomyces phage Wakanda]YP_010652376.1 Holliday junction resolvase [Streptomyces phage Muntaha]QIN94056.1 Holliday junction resolvase [Streptomyces phage Wakanda]QIN94621.1 Holliday junction resolvase [Streptomyces phage Muntaha]